MTRDREYVDHEFEGRKWKIYVKEEVTEEKKIKEGKIVYKRMVKEYLRINCPKADGLICGIIKNQSL